MFVSHFGWDGPSADIVAYGRQYIERHLWSHNHLIHSVVARDGRILRADFDLYDHAFVLFGFATVARYDAACRDVLARVAHALLTRMKAGFAHPLAGFEEEHPRRVPLLANPHMHILEAALAWREAWPNPLWDDLAREIVNLCLQHLLDQETGALLELFDGEWSPLQGESQAPVEPGHQFEWAWLLIRFAKIARRPEIVKSARRLVEIGEQNGVDPTRDLAINGLDLRLNIIDPLARLWPQTERIKANIAVASLEDDDRLEAIERAARACAGLRRFLEHPLRGAWWEHIGVDGYPITEPTRASSLYHIVCAVSVVRDFIAQESQNSGTH